MKISSKGKALDKWSHEFRNTWRQEATVDLATGYNDLTQKAGNQVDEEFHRIQYLRRPKSYSESATQSLTNASKTIKY